MLGALGLQTGVSGRAGIEPAETPKAPLTARHSVVSLTQFSLH